MFKTKSLLNQPVYTPHGKATVIREFSDGTVCVEFEHGGGMVLLKDQIFPQKPLTRPEVQVKMLVA